VPEAWYAEIIRSTGVYAKNRSFIAAEVRQAFAPKAAITHEVLSYREAKVLSDLERGLTYKEMAAHQKMTVNGIKSAQKTLYAKLGVHSALEAVRQGKAEGLI
jgi:DNA-binding NarL/FixJ family response regulator